MASVSAQGLILNPVQSYALSHPCLSPCIYHIPFLPFRSISHICLLLSAYLYTPSLPFPVPPSNLTTASIHSTDFFNVFTF